MALFVRRSILEEFLIVVFGVFFGCGLAAKALAQHPGAPAVHTVGPPPMHIGAPPVLHMPMAPAPLMQPPIIRAPISAPRFSPVPSAGALRPVFIRPPRWPVRPIPPVVIFYTPPFIFGTPLWGLNSCWWADCGFFGAGTFDYTSVSSPGPTNYVTQVYETPVYIYGLERSDLPQLYLKDGTIFNVTDYWLVDGQLHFTIMEEGGAKSEQVIPFDELDLQKTVDADTRRGFRFMLRNEPFEEYVRHHPEGPPPVITPNHE